MAIFNRSQRYGQQPEPTPDPYGDEAQWTREEFYREQMRAHESLAAQTAEDDRARQYVRGRRFRDQIAADTIAARKRIDAIARLERALEMSDRENRGNRNGR